MLAHLHLPRHVVLRATYVVLSLLVTAGLVAAAALAHAPAAVLPLLIVLVIALPMTAAWELPDTLACLRRGTFEGRARARLRRELDRLPETRHPLGL